MAARILDGSFFASQKLKILYPPGIPFSEATTQPAASIEGVKLFCYFINTASVPGNDFLNMLDKSSPVEAFETAPLTGNNALKISP